jgi:D-glycero-D-manno-heptose 1,7-bisphosphate phosphatase
MTSRNGDDHKPVLLRPAAFFDRDGVLNVDRGFVHKPDDLVWIPGAMQAVRLLNEAGYIVIVVTNQSGVARGYYDEADVHDFHAHMQGELRLQGAHIDAFYFCPHHPEGNIARYAITCDCRKPRTGLLEQATRGWEIDLSRSFLIGDRDGDMVAAEDFKIKGIRFDAQKDDLLTLVTSELRIN